MQDRATAIGDRQWLGGVYLVIGLLVIPMGLVARSFRDGADASSFAGFVWTYLGDTLWAVMFFFLIAAGVPRWRTSALSAVTLMLTLAIEFSQRYEVEPLASLRAFPPTAFLLGKQFLWSDVACLFVGTLLAAIIHLALPGPADRSAL